MGGRSRRPRLCMVVHGPYPIGEPRVAREVRVAQAAGFDVDVLALRRPEEPARELIDGARVVRLPLSHRRGAGLVSMLVEYVGFAILATLRLAGPAVRRRYDVVQVHNPPDFLIAAALLPRLTGARVVLDVHDLSPDMFAMRFGGRRGARAADRILRALERAAAAVADAVVTVHEPYRRELVSRGVPAAKLVVVMNALDESLLPESTDRRSDGFRVVYHGTLTPPYGVDLLVAACAAAARDVPDLALEVYGEGDAAAGLARAAEVAGLDGRFSLSGRYLPHAEVLARVAGAAVGVVPNRPMPLNRFALSSKLFEYVALGIPVVAADLPTLREHFGDDEVLYFPAGDPAGLTAALVAVARDPAAALRRADAARRRYASYRWPVSAARYAALLNRLAGS